MRKRHQWGGDLPHAWYVRPFTRHPFETRPPMTTSTMQSMFGGVRAILLAGTISQALVLGCASSEQTGGSGGSSGSGGATGSGGASSGGATGSGGASSGGATGSGGASSGGATGSGGASS